MINYIVSTTTIERKQQRVVRRPDSPTFSLRPPPTMSGPLLVICIFISHLIYATLSPLFIIVPSRRKSVLLHITLQQRIGTLAYASDIIPPAINLTM
jgi:hypothetical protein